MRWLLLLLVLSLVGCAGRDHLQQAERDRDDLRARIEVVKEGIKELPQITAHMEELEKEAARLRKRRDQLKAHK